MQSNKKFKLGHVSSISLAHLLHDIYGSFLAPVLPILIEKFSLSYTLSGILTLSQRLPSLANPIVGIIADRIRMRYLMIISPLITAVCMSLIGLAPNYGLLLVLLITAGFSSILFHVPSPVAINQFSGNRIGFGMSLYMLGGEIARTTGPLVILTAVSVWGFEGSWKLIPFGLGASVFLFFRFRKIPFSKPVKKEKSKNRGLKGHYRFFLILMGFLLFAAMLKSGLTAFLPTFYTEKGYNLWDGGLALALFQLFGAAGTMMAGPLSDRIGRKKSIILFSILTPVSAFLFLISNGIFQFVFLAMCGIFIFSPTPIILSMVQRRKSEQPAFLNSIYMTLTFVLGSLAVMLVSALADYISLEKAYFLTSIGSTIAIVFAFLFPNEKGNTGQNE